MTADTKPAILLTGAGALGLFFTSRIAELADIFVYARSDRDALKRSGGVYEIRSEKLGDSLFRPAGILEMDETPDFEPDYLFVCLKALDGLDQPALCRNAVSRNTVIVIIENGLGNEEPFRKAFPDNVIISTAAYLGASRPEPGVVRHTDGGRLVFGLYHEPDGISGQAPLERLAGLFNTAGIPAEITDNIRQKRWIKLLWNIGFNPVSVLANDADTEQLLGNPFTAALIRELMNELCAIAAADGIVIPPEVVDDTIAYSEQFAAYRPSMLQDFAVGKAIELDAILGVPLRLAERYQIPAPCLKTVYALMTVAARKDHPVPAAAERRPDK